MYDRFRKGFRVIQGGKGQTPPVGFDPSSLLEDRFLRNHFLEGREKEDSPRHLQPVFPAFTSKDRDLSTTSGFNDFPDAG